jgi:hypothetical protein
MSNELAWCLGEVHPGEARLSEVRPSGPKLTVQAQFTIGQAAAAGEVHHQRTRDLPIRLPQRPAGDPRRAHSNRKAATAEMVLRSFNTWAFKREQPADPVLLSRTIADAVSRNEPVCFILYWGKGPRAHVAEPDIACLDFLDTFSRRVGEAYSPGATIELIFTDTHANLNGHTSETIRQYFAEVDTQAVQRCFSTRLLSEITRAAQACPDFRVDEAPVSEDILERLSTSAGKWYRGEGTARDGALKYYRMNMIEKRAVERAFPRAIFATFNGSDLRCLFPDHLPVFYMYSLRRGFSVKPWFLPTAGAGNFERVDVP